MKKIIALAAIAALSACTQTVAEIKASDTYTVTHLHSEQNYQAAYRNIVNQARDCWVSGGLAMEWVMDSHIYTDNQTANVMLSTMHGPYGRITHFYIEMASAPDGTNMTVWSREKKTAADFVGWANGRYTSCDGK